MTRAERLAKKQAKAAAKTDLPKMYEIVANVPKSCRNQKQPKIVYQNYRKKQDRPLPPNLIIDNLNSLGIELSNRIKSKAKISRRVLRN